MREPIQRTTSFIKRVTSSKSFARCLLDGADKLGDEVFWKNFERYIYLQSKMGLMAHERHGFSNYMTKAIAGCDLSQENLVVDDSTLEQAKNNLNDMVYVGTFENYQTAVQDILNLFEVNANFRSDDLKVSKVPPSTEKLLKEINHYDIELYKYFINKK